MGYSTILQRLVHRTFYMCVHVVFQFIALFHIQSGDAHDADMSGADAQDAFDKAIALAFAVFDFDALGMDIDIVTLLATTLAGAAYAAILDKV